MSGLVLSYDRDVWLHLDDQPVGEADLASRLDDAPAGWTADELSRIVETARTAPSFTEDAERFLLVAEDRTWFVLEVNLLSADPAAPLDPAADFEGLTPEAVRLSDELAGHRLVTMDPAGPLEGLGGPPSEILLPHLHYFLEFAGGQGWVYAGMVVPDPLALPAVVPLVEQLLAGTSSA